MTTANSLGGVGSGIDTTALITGLVNADSGRLNALKTKQTSTNSAVSTLSDISTSLGSLQNAVDALSTPDKVGSYTGTSSSPAIAVSTSGNAQPGTYSMSVTQLAQAQRTYSNTFQTANSPLNNAGTLSLQVGTGAAKSISIGASDTLDQIVTKINGSGARVGAAVLFDGTEYRLQIRGLDTGKDNALTIGQSGGLDLGLNDPANTIQKAQDSIVKIDGFDVQRSTNQVVGALQGVTLALTSVTTSPVDVKVGSDSQGLATKISSIVTAYNAVLNKVNTAAGHGSTKATNSELASDSTLRGIVNRLSTSLQTVTGSGRYTTLGSVGLSLQKDGTLALDSAKLSAAVSSDSAAVSTLFAGNGTSTGVMSTLSHAIKAYNQTGTGLLAQHTTELKSRSTAMDDRINSEQDRLTRYQTQLQKQFSAMDTTVTSNNSDMGYLAKLYGTSTG